MQFHAFLRVGEEPCLPPHCDSVASPCPCPSPFPPRSPADSLLLALLYWRQRLDEWDGHLAVCENAVDQQVGVGVGADTVKNGHPLPH
jgi:hypothetical protein